MNPPFITSRPPILYSLSPEVQNLLLPLLVTLPLNSYLTFHHSITCYTTRLLLVKFFVIVVRVTTTPMPL